MESRYDRRLPSRVPRELTQPPARNLVDYRKLLEEFQRLGSSRRVKILRAGHSREGREISYLAISDERNIERLAQLRNEIQESYPTVKFNSINKFIVKGTASAFGDIPSVVMLHAATYGFEAAHTEALLRVASVLAFAEEPSIREALSKLIVIVVPMMNPDGRQMALDEWSDKSLCFGSRGMGNSRGAILNRDFAAMTEPETRAVHQIYNEWQPCAAYDPHEDMMFLGVHPEWPEICWCPPFGKPIHPGIADETVSRINELSTEIASRWRSAGFPYRSAIDSKEPLLTFLSSESFGVHFSLHGTPVVVTESSRTPGANSWEERIRQKTEAAFAIIRHVASVHPEFAYSRHEVLSNYCHGEVSGFVIPFWEGSQEDMLTAKLLVDKLQEHSIQVYLVSDPRTAFLIPLNQPSRAVILDILGPTSWNPWGLAAAYGVKVLRLEDTELKRCSDAPFSQVAETAFRLIMRQLGSDADTWMIPNTFQGVRLVNRLLQSGEKILWALEDFAVENVKFKAGTFLWQAGESALPPDVDWVGTLFKAPFPTAKHSIVQGARVAVYDGAGTNGMNSRHRADLDYALSIMGFQYDHISPDFVRSGELDKYSLVIVPNGDAKEISEGTNTNLGWQKAPWDVSVEEGLSAEGIERLRDYLHHGGTYLGIGCGGAALASKQVSGLTSADLVCLHDEEGRHMYGSGTAKVHIRVEDRNTPVALGLPDMFYAHYHSDPLLLKYNNIMFHASGSYVTVATYTGVDSETWTNLWLRPETFAKGYGAVVYVKEGDGACVLIGFDPVYGARWLSTYRLVSNSIFGRSQRGTSRGQAIPRTGT